MVVAVVDSGSFHIFEVIHDDLCLVLDHASRVLIVLIRHLHMDLVGRVVVQRVVVLRNFVLNIDTQRNRCFKCPTPRNISKGITTSSSENGRDSKAFDVLHTLAVTPN